MHSKAHDQTSGKQGLGRFRRLVGLTGATSLAVMLMLAITPGVAALALDIAQCNGVGNGGGQGLDCRVEVVNDLDITDPMAPIQSSTVTVSTCLGAANAALAGVCTNTGPISYAEVVTDIDQCNYSDNGGGSTVLCTVDVLNYVTGGGATPTPATVNECNNSLTTGDVLICDPYLTGPQKATDPSTATVVQCNDSVNGGGGVLDCSLAQGSTTNAALVVRVNQCNNSANGGGSLIICRTVIRNAVRAAVVDAFVPPAPVTVAATSPEAQTFVPVRPIVATPPRTAAPASTRLARSELAVTGSAPSSPLLLIVGGAALLGGLLILSRKIAKEI